MTPTTSPVTVFLPDGSVAISTHTSTLDWPNIAVQARQAHVFPTFSGSLISIGLLCDCGYTATYDSNKVTIRDAKNIILTGLRDPSTK
jgi:hypothetical protein